MDLDIRQIARLVGGRLTPADAGGTVCGVSTDSRSLAAGELFVPLRGENFDGHDFLSLAVQKGAAACLSEEVVAGLSVPVIEVPDTLRALGDLAAGVRQGFVGPVVGVTGSSGKTTTKDMLTAILAQTGPGLSTAGNFNNLIGLPLTLLRRRTEDQWMVLEMGMSARGEIARLAQIASPTVGVVTNIGEAHLETLFGLDGVARAKGELFVALPAGGTAVINGDDERVANLPVANGVRRLVYGLASDAAVSAQGVEVGGSTVSFELCLPSGSYPVRLQVAGRYNVHNALAAAAAAVALGVEEPLIARGLEAFRPARARMELVHLKDGALLIEDCYNANPLSVRAALVTLEEMGGSGRRIAVLGDMLELGDASAQLHRDIGRVAAGCADWLLLLGEMAQEVAAGALEAGMPADKVRHVADHAEGIAVLRSLLRAGDRVLVKGSRGMRMEKITEALRDGDACLAAGNG